MKNIKVPVDNEVYHRARIRAAERRTSVSALVRRALQELAAEDTEFERLKRLERDVLHRLHARKSRFAASERMTRNQAHNRGALR
jgi:Arc/MetJ-type ribon-helix-helix transcriptional regulator